MKLQKHNPERYCCLPIVVTVFYFVQSTKRPRQHTICDGNGWDMSSIHTEHSIESASETWYDACIRSFDNNVDRRSGRTYDWFNHMKRGLFLFVLIFFLNDNGLVRYSAQFCDKLFKQWNYTKQKYAYRTTWNINMVKTVATALKRSMKGI